MDSLKRLAGWVGDRIAPLNWDTMFLVKTAVTVAIIVGVSEIVKRSPSIGALIVALPFTSILVMIWMQVEGQPASKIATHSSSTFWFVLPTLPMFLVLPKLLEAKSCRGMDFTAGTQLASSRWAGTHLLR